jgi:hypothetical protein
MRLTSRGVSPDSGLAWAIIEARVPLRCMEDGSAGATVPIVRRCVPEPLIEEQDYRTLTR